MFNTTPSCPARDVFEAWFGSWCREQFQGGEEYNAMCVQQGVCHIDGGRGLSPKETRPLICRSGQCNEGYKGAQLATPHKDQLSLLARLTRVSCAGFLCNSCEFGFFRKDATCVHCPEKTWLSTLLVTTLVILLVIVIVKGLSLVSKMKVTSL